MVVTLCQQYNIREKPTVILYTYINRHAGTPEKQRKKQNKIWYIVIIYCYIGCEDEVTTLEREQKRAHDVDIFNVIQTVQDIVIHLEVDEEQWKITQGSKRQTKLVWSPRTMPGLRLPDTPHAQHQHNDPRAFRPETKEGVSS